MNKINYCFTVNQNITMTLLAVMWYPLTDILILNIFNAKQSVSGHVKKSITSSFFNEITFHLTVRFKTFQ